MIDGIYICSTSQHPLLSFINKLYSRLAIAFIQETKPLHRFLVRSGLAFGPVVRGRDTLNCAYELRRHPRHAEQILLGPTLAQAYQTEGDSAPFGVALHESARTFSPYGENVMSGTYWQWWKNHSREGDDELARKLYDSLVEHYKWCSENTNGLSYKKENIDRHRLLAKEYFSN